MMNRNYFRQKKSFIDQFLEGYSILSGALVLIFSVISISGYYVSYYSRSQFEKETFGESSYAFFSFLILYSQLFPISIYGVLDLFYLFSIRNLQSVVKKQENSIIKVNNPDVLSNIGHVNKNIHIKILNVFIKIDYLFMDKMIGIIKDQSQICRINIYNKQFEIETEDLQKQLIKHKTMCVETLHTLQNIQNTES